MRPRVYVTGLGIVSAIGIGVEETFHALHKLESGIGQLTLFESVHNSIPVAEVKLTNADLAGHLNMEGDLSKQTRNTLLALLAAKQAVFSSGWTDTREKMTGAVFATTVGGMDFNEQFYKSLLVEDTHSDLVDVLDSADSTEKVAAHYGIRYHVTTISTACSSSANALMVGARLIKSNRLQRVLVVGTDSLTRFTLNGFNALEILSPTGCRPFDKSRNGLTIGEGAAALVLESETVAHPDKIICEVAGYANVNEAYHATASSADGFGAVQAMRRALESASVHPAAIGYINAHGTGTIVNDLSEGIAIGQIFGHQIPPVSSTKAFTGHTLGAAGAVEAVFSCLALQHQRVLPGLNFAEPMPELSFEPCTVMQPQKIEHVMSNSFGFGGSNTTLIFSKA